MVGCITMIVEMMYDNYSSYVVAIAWVRFRRQTIIVPWIQAGIVEMASSCSNTSLIYLDPMQNLNNWNFVTSHFYRLQLRLVILVHMPKIKSRELFFCNWNVQALTCWFAWFRVTLHDFILLCQACLGSNSWEALFFYFRSLELISACFNLDSNL
jgi:hypothetical protein